MPRQSRAEHVGCHRITGHGEVLFVHERCVEVLILREELQSDMLHIEVGIHVHHRVVAHFLHALHAELSQGRIEHRCVILGEQAHIHTYLHVQSFHPCAVIVEVVVQCQRRQWDILRRAVLIYDAIIQVHPRGGDIQL